MSTSVSRGFEPGKTHQRAGERDPRGVWCGTMIHIFYTIDTSTLGTEARTLVAITDRSQGVGGRETGRAPAVRNAGGGMLLTNKSVDWLLVGGVASVFSPLGLMAFAVFFGF